LSHPPHRQSLLLNGVGDGHLRISIEISA